MMRKPFMVAIALAALFNPAAARAVIVPTVELPGPIVIPPRNIVYVDGRGIGAFCGPGNRKERRCQGRVGPLACTPSAGF